MTITKSGLHGQSRVDVTDEILGDLLFPTSGAKIAPVGLLPITAVQAMLGGFHRTTIYTWIRQNKFPPPVKIGGSSRWIADEVQEWRKKRLAGRRLWGVQR